MSPQTSQTPPKRTSASRTPRTGAVSGIAGQRGRPAPTNTTPVLDYALVGILATLLALGLIAVLSAGLVSLGIEFFLKQVGAVILGLVAMLVLSRIPYHFWQRLAVPILVLALGLLVAVLAFGEERFGAKRTLGYVFQPSEFVKLAVIIYISAWVAAKGKQVERLQDGLLPFTILMTCVTVLLVLEPSLSVAIIILVIGITIFFVGGANIKQLLVLGGLGVALLLLVIQQYPHASGRIDAWLNPGQAPFNARSVWQNGLLGQGPFLERIVQLSPVPLPYNDYLFAHIGHLTGILGALVIVVLFAALGYRCLGIALNAPDKFGILVGVGITTWILVQAAIHMGSSMSLIPQTGQPLPFMSQGGSAMVACLAAMGLMMSIWRESPEKKALHASNVIRGRDWRPRLPDSLRGERAQSHTSGARTRRPARGQPGYAFGVRPVRRAGARQSAPRTGPQKSEGRAGKPAQRRTGSRSGDHSHK